MEVLERSARKLELARRLEADVSVHAFESDDLAVLENRFPPELGEAEEQIADAAGFIP